MGVFNDMLKSDETLFRDTVALDYDYIPKVIPFREAQQRYVAACMKPLFQRMNGKNLVVFGKPGVGKTVATKHLLTEIEQETDDIIPIYINCWKHNSSFKIFAKICEDLDYKFVQNKRSDELFKIIKQMLNKQSAVLVFDEIDKAEDHDFLYNLLEEVYRKTIVLITNYPDWVKNLDQRIKSRLMPDMLEFKTYNAIETRGILKERLNFAFINEAWDDSAFEFVVEKAFKMEDIRTGLYLMRESGLIAENYSSKKIVKEHVLEAIKKLDDFSVNNKEDLDDESKKILALIKDNSGKKIGDLFKLYQEQGGKTVYKTFQRKMKKLEQGKFIDLERVMGAEGNTSIVSLNSKEKETKLGDF